MKKLIFMFLVITSPIFAQWDYLPNRPERTSYFGDDLVVMLWDSSGTPTWRYTLFSTFFSAIEDTADLYYPRLSLSNTFTGINAFNGATFGAGAHGKVIFVDSLVNTSGITYLNFGKPVSALAYWGSVAQPYNQVTARNFVVVNAEENDSAYINLDDSTISFTKALKLTDNISFDSASTFSVFNFEPHPYTIPTVGDTILTLTTSNLFSCIELDLPGDLTPGISNFQIDTATKGMVLRIYNADALYDAYFVDLVGGDDNLYMSGNFTQTAGHYDFIEFQCVDATKGAQKWMQTSKSDN